MSAIFDYMGYMRVYTNPLNTARYVTATFSTDTELHSFFANFSHLVLWGQPQSVRVTSWLADVSNCTKYRKENLDIRKQV